MNQIIKKKYRKINISTPKRGKKRVFTEVEFFYENCYFESVNLLMNDLETNKNLFLPTLWMINHYIEITLKYYIIQSHESNKTAYDLKIITHNNSELLEREEWRYLIETDILTLKVFNRLKRVVNYFDKFKDKFEDSTSIISRYPVNSRKNTPNLSAISYEYWQFRKKWLDFIIVKTIIMENHKKLLIRLLRKMAEVNHEKKI